MSELSWVGLKVRNVDGREGVIRSEYAGRRRCLLLSISIKSGGFAYVQIDPNMPDTGEAGWEWWCEASPGRPRQPLPNWFESFPRRPRWPLPND